MSSGISVTPTIQKAYRAALVARQNSHSPYSRFKVGAALQLRGKAEPIAGCNVENASYGATVCAERVALHGAVAQFGRIEPEFLIVVTGEAAATVPCALCLQSLAEFCPDSMPVYLGNEQAIQRQLLFCELLPHAFRQFQISP